MDPGVCEGHGQCMVVDYDLFPLDDDGLLAPSAPTVPFPEGEEDVARIGVDACPVRALSLHE